MENSDLILYLPFDDPDGCDKAFDFTLNRADAILTDGAFLTKDAKFGKSLNLNGGGECQTTTGIPFTSDWTLSLYLKVNDDKIGWLINHSGIDNYYEKWVSAQRNEWVFFVFVRKSNTFTAYQNGVVVDTYISNDAFIGFSINDCSIGGSSALIDEVKLYNTAKSHSDVLKEQYQNRDVEYYVDGVNFKDYGVEVSDSSGIIGIPDKKEPLSVDWGTYHGVAVDRRRTRFKERTITLNCFIEAQSKSQFILKVMEFVNVFIKDETRRLKIEYSGKTLPLVYEVMCMNAADVSKKWRYDDGLMVGTFQLKLIEYEPVKRVLRHIGAAGSTASITASSNKLLNIYWGDGSYTFNVSGNNQTVTHTYEIDGEYDIIIAGVIEDITDFTTDCIVIWNKLL